MKASLPLSIAFFLSLAGSLSAQRAADWSVELNGSAQQIIFQNLTGVPIVQTDKAFIGIDPATRKVAWTVERTPAKVISLDTGPEFFNLAGAPFLLIRNSMIDSRNGRAVLSKAKDGYKRIDDFEVLPALDAVLVRTTAADGKLRLYLLRSSDGLVQWWVDVMKPSVIVGMDEEPEEEFVDVPLYTTLVTPDSHLIFRYRKNLAVISPKGQLLWNEKADPAEVLFSPDHSKVLVIRALVTGLGNSPVEVRHVVKYRGTRLAAYDLRSGKEAWASDIKTDQNIRWADAHPDFLTVVEKKGCNLYDYATGKALWTADFKGRRVVEIQPNAEGYLVTYESGFKSMQLDRSGRALWPKPRVLETDDAEEDDSAEEGDQDLYVYAKGRVLVDANRARFRPAKGSGMKKWRVMLNAGSRVAFDDSLRNLIILTGNRLYLVNPDQPPAADKTVAVRSHEVDFVDPAAFHTMELRPGGYFLTSRSEAVFVAFANQGITHRTFTPPFDGEGLLARMAGIELAANMSFLQHQAADNAQRGAHKAALAAIGLLPPGAGNTERRAARNQFLAADALGFALSLMPPARAEAFQQTPDHAYYLISEKGQPLLVGIRKDGLEYAGEPLKFDNARPIYRVDEIERRVYYAYRGVLKVFSI